MKEHLFRILFAPLVLLLTPVSSTAQQISPNQLLNMVYQKIQKANDYSVEANIKVDLPFVKMLPVNATIYFKQKDKLKVESKSIAIVPKQGFDQISKMLSDSNAFTCMIQGEETIGTNKTTIINIIPLSDTTDLVLGKLWIDPAQKVVIRSQLTTKSNGTIITDYTYGSQMAYGLPDMLVFSIDAKKFKLPKVVDANNSDSKPTITDKQKENKKGKIYVKLSKYQINQGLTDKFFSK